MIIVCLPKWNGKYPLRLLQEEKSEDDPLPVDVPADPTECRMDAVISRFSLPVLQLHLLLSARELP